MDRLQRLLLTAGVAEPETQKAVLKEARAHNAAVCPACAERARSLRAAQCREGWHLEDEPIPAPGPPDDWQAWLLEQRAEMGEGRARLSADQRLGALGKPAWRNSLVVLRIVELWRQRQRAPGHRFRGRMWGFCPPPAFGAFWRM